MHLQRRLLLGIGALVLLISIGTFGYVLIEGWNFSDAIYMTIITLSTVGYKEVDVLSNAGRVFTGFLIVGGVGVIFYTATSIIEYFIEQGLRGIFWRRRMEKQISKLKNHFIVCGYGRVGKEVAVEFARRKVPFVIIDPGEAAFTKAKEEGYLCIPGSASSDETLEKARISCARGLIAAAGSDSDNVFITLCGRELNPKVFIVSRACHGDSISKLERAGANKVVLPLRVGGNRMAMLAMRPMVVNFIDTFFGKPSSPFELEDIMVADNSPLSGKSVGEGEKLAGLTILALRKKDSTLIPKPGAEAIIEAGDELVVIGKRKHLEKVEAETT